ncbi:MAG: hypothetical protein KDA61_13650, partial [Planctomycetales bacterium]|nr:hypothetical protein [Planctomycetales bacterium]
MELVGAVRTEQVSGAGRRSAPTSTRLALACKLLCDAKCTLRATLASHFVAPQFRLGFSKGRLRLPRAGRHRRFAQLSPAIGLAFAGYGPVMGQ